MARHCAGVLVVPPYFFKDPTPDGVFRFYDELIARTGCESVYLYHYPRLSQVPISHDLVARLVDAHGDAIAGIKDSTGDPESLAGYVDAFPSLAVMPGTEKFFLDALRQGAAGVITAGANVNATAIREVWDAHQAGDAERAEHAQAGVTAYRLWLQQNPTVPALRSLLSKIDDGFARTVPPFSEALPELGDPPA
jgi:4-hydroxy-tetrahydrodipicolinate synthase